ncbi:MAG: hypothetical protein A2Y07_03205 [Planctomycetes bacterium GWF2_50_10]|nr:MAG: hypothetical protein A2Y07_03205 [Planctomycetes bacterium GWF2_50_10]
MAKFNFILIAALCLISTPLFAGNLEPTAAPGSTMKPLSEIEPGTAISSLPYTISTSGSYYFTANLTIPNSLNGVSINADNVTIDLKGFTLDGNKVVTHAISAAKRKNITIKNGIFVNWYANGLYLGDSNNCRIENLSFSNTGRSAISVGNNAIVQKCIIANCRDSSNYSAISATGQAIITNCVVSDCNYIGIKTQDRAIISDCSVKNCGDAGIVTSNTSIIKNCVTVDNGDYGLRVDAGSIVESCAALNNADHGMYINNSTAINNNCSSNQASGMFVTGTGCRIESNTCNNNTAYGFYISSSSSNVVVRNFAKGNLSGNYSVSSGSVAPATSNPGTASAWANFGF